MADDRMKHDDAQRNMGNKDDQDIGRQSPGRSGQGQQAGGQQGGQFGGGQKGQGQGARDLDDEEEFGTGKTGGQQNRGGQNR